MNFNKFLRKFVAEFVRKFVAKFVRTFVAKFVRALVARNISPGHVFVPRPWTGLTTDEYPQEPAGASWKELVPAVTLVPA